MQSFQLLLASTSRYRRELLSRLMLPFDAVAPDVDETPLPGESPEGTASRLARAKAQVVARLHPSAIVIGSDQVAEFDGLRLDKPGTRDRAIAQLEAVSGRAVEFRTAVCVAVAGGARISEALVPTRVTFRAFDRATAERYVDLEQPLDCAGSAKAEGLGIALIASIVGDDPTALIGLPLIATVTLLREFGVDPLDTP
jgi:septum formation protein